MLAEVFLVCALAAPGVPYRHYSKFGFTQEDVSVVKLLRDWPNGSTGSRPSSKVLVYSADPSWVLLLATSGIKTVAMWNEHTYWSNLITKGDPRAIPFPIFSFQLYLFDAKDSDYPPFSVLALEASRVVKPWGFFLLRSSVSTHLPGLMKLLGWDKMEWQFHDFEIWHRRHYFKDVRASA